MRVLVTGGCGYIGTNLTCRLLHDGHEVTVVDTMWFGNHLDDHENLDIIKSDVRDIDLVPMEGINTVIHLANIANDPTGDLNPKLTWEVNVLASKLLIERSIEQGVKRFIYASSGSVYGVKEEPSVTEDLSLLPISDYNKTKMISERVLLSYKDCIDLAIIRPATVCGYSPRMRLDLSVNMLTMQALQSGAITVFGGAQTRPNIHMSDMVGVYVHFLERDEIAGIYNAGFENLSIMEIAERVVRHIPAEILVSESNDPRSYRLSSSKLLKTDFVPKFDVDYAIRELVTLYREDKLKDTTQCYNIRQMETIGNLQ